MKYVCENLRIVLWSWVIIPFRFCSSASHDLALIYNDRAILENMSGPWGLWRLEDLWHGFDNCYLDRRCFANQQILWLIAHSRFTDTMQFPKLLILFPFPTDCLSHAATLEAHILYLQGHDSNSSLVTLWRGRTVGLSGSIAFWVFKCLSFHILSGLQHFEDGPVLQTE